MRHFLSTLVLILMVSALTGVGVYRWMLDSYGPTCAAGCADLVNELEAISAQLAVAEQEIDVLLQEKGAVETGAERTACTDVFTSGPGTETVRYTNEAKHIAFDISYNPVWGYEGETIEPYEDLPDADAVLFGPPEELEACSWAYSRQVSFLPVRNLDEIASDVKERNADRLGTGEVAEADVMPRQVILDDMELYMYKVPGFCEALNIELLGNKFNYVFTACFTAEEDLLNIIRSVEQVI